MSEYQRDCELDDAHEYTQLLSLRIKRLFQNANSFGLERSPEKFQLLANEIQNLVYSLISQLKGLKVDQFIITWTIVVDELFEQLYVTRENLEIICPLNKTAKMKTGQIVSEVNELFISFVSSVKVGDLPSAYFDRLLLNVFESCESNLAVDCGCINHSRTVLEYCVGYVKHQSAATVKSFHILSQLLKVMYNTGNPSLVEGIFHLLSPELPLKFKERVEYDDMEDYYKYASFSLLATAVDDLTTINDAYCWEADKYFKCLLSLPSMDYNFIPHLKEAIDNLDKLEELHKQKEIGKLLSRQEVSLMFILNSILMCHELEEVVDLSAQVKQELDLLNKTLNCIVNRNSAVNIWAQNTIVINDEFVPPILHCQSLSSIVLNGSYEEKSIGILFLVGNLLRSGIKRIGQLFSLEKEETVFKKLAENTDAEKFPGYIRYYKLLDLISKLLSLLQLKYIIRNVGGSSFDSTSLPDCLGRREVGEVLSVKPLLKCDISDTTYNFVINDVFIVATKSIIQHQVELAEGVRDIETGMDQQVNEVISDTRVPL